MTPDTPDRHIKAEDTPSDGVSRRQLLTAGLAAAGAGLVTAPAHAETAARIVGVAVKGTTAVEFQVRFTQSGPTGELFAGFGYLTRLDGAAEEDLFSGGPHNETTALLTAVASGALTHRINDGTVHSIDIEGTLTVYQRAVPGASFADPGSFEVGTAVAVFTVVLQDVLTVFAPGKGLPTLSGDLRQISADKIVLQDGRWPFGHVGARARLSATGLGTLTNPATLNSVHEMGGNWTTV